MKAKELMIGDWVRISHRNKIGKVYRVDEANGDGNGWAAVIDGDWHENDLQPIPLASELLEQNGFKKFNFHDIEGQHQWTWWNDTQTSVSLWCRELNDNPKDGWMVRVESPLATCCYKVEYVHELQHTFRLTGIDKDIKVED